jgi:hypothetical protein
MSMTVTTPRGPDPVLHDAIVTAGQPLASCPVSTYCLQSGLDNSVDIVHYVHRAFTGLLNALPYLPISYQLNALSVPLS